jgi:hypothetical protein
MVLQTVLNNIVDLIVTKSQPKWASSHLLKNYYIRSLTTLQYYPTDLLFELDALSTWDNLRLLIQHIRVQHFSEFQICLDSFADFSHQGEKLGQPGEGEVLLMANFQKCKRTLVIHQELQLL